MNSPDSPEKVELKKRIARLEKDLETASHAYDVSSLGDEAPDDTDMENIKEDLRIANERYDNL